MKTDIFAIQSTCMEVSVSLLCLFVHEPPYQTTVVCCNAVFRRGSSCMDHRTVFHVRVGLAPITTQPQCYNYPLYSNEAIHQRNWMITTIPLCPGSYHPVRVVIIHE